MGVADDLAGGFEDAERVEDGLFAGADGGAQRIEMERSGRERGEDPRFEGIGRGWCFPSTQN